MRHEEDIDGGGRWRAGGRWSDAIALAQADVIKERQENRKETAAAMRSIKGVIDSKGDMKTVVAAAAKLKTLEAAFDEAVPGRLGQGRHQGPADGVERHGGLPGRQQELPMPPTTSSPSQRAQATSRLSRRRSPTPARPAAPATTKFRAKAN